jgi:hypothetical protein
MSENEIKYSILPLSRVLDDINYFANERDIPVYLGLI